MPLAWASLIVPAIAGGATAITQAAPARFESMTVLSSCVWVVGLKLGSWTMTVQPFDAA